MSSVASAQRHVLIGAETPLSRALNDLARAKIQGVDTRPWRASRSFFETGHPPLDGRAFVSGLRLLGPPMTREGFFAQAETRLGASGICSMEAATAILAIAPLSQLHVGSGDERLARTRWEDLYALSWTDLVVRIRAVLGPVPLVVLTPRGGALQSASLIRRFFGPGVADARALLRASLNEAGRGKLGRIEDAGRLDAVPALYATHAETRGPAQAEKALAIDPVTFDLLEDRFAEDVARIAQMDGVELV